MQWVYEIRQENRLTHDVKVARIVASSMVEAIQASGLPFPTRVTRSEESVEVAKQ